MNNKIDILIMAAGASRRFGDCKLLAHWSGAPLITHSINAAIKLADIAHSPITSITIVGGAYHDSIRELLRQHSHTTLNLLNCPDWSLGLGHSIAYGVSQLPPENSVLIMLADQPLVAEEDLRQFVDLAAENPGKIICAEFAETIGVPALFPTEFKNYLQQLTGDRGAKMVLVKHENSLIKLLVNAAAFDVDLPADLGSVAPG